MDQYRWLPWKAWVFAVVVACFSGAFNLVAQAETYQQRVLNDGPVGYWSFDGKAQQDGAVVDLIKGYEAKSVGAVKLNQPGPRSYVDHDDSKDMKDGELVGYTVFGTSNNALSLSGGRMVIQDPGDQSVFDFDKGDTITIEAWVNVGGGIKNGQQVYVVGKGRTQNKGVAVSNQNWALRVRNTSGAAVLSFLFRGEENKAWHRWNSNEGFGVGSGWHHLVVSYTFGEPDSIQGYIDGRETDGKWDYAGKTTHGPVVDNDEIWIGSSMGGSASSSLHGGIDELAIYRKRLSAETIAKRYRYTPGTLKLNIDGLKPSEVRVEVFEGMSNRKWNDPRTLKKPVESFTQHDFAFARVPRKYNQNGIIVDRSQSYLLRAAGKIEFGKGKQRLLLRSLNGSRLWIDGRMLAVNRFALPQGDAHQLVDKPPVMHHPSIRILPVGHSENIVEFESDGQEHVVMVEVVLGGKSRQEIGEFSLSLDCGEEGFKILAPNPRNRYAFTDSGWDQFARSHDQFIRAYDREKRAGLALNVKPYWDARHEEARKALQQEKITIPEPVSSSAVNNNIDSYINARLEREGIQPAGLTDDLALLRRVYLDTVGVLPTEREINRYLNDSSDARRVKVIQRLLEDDRFADHWVSYFQDVLAENPGILKPMLNNTGPFRWWIYESLIDNKPMDQFVTELVMMEGSKYYGGPRGFEMASQNDVPMGAKAHVISQAFLGIEMKCARCHDAPYHDVKQKDLFNVGAMLKRKPISIPESSSVPGGLKATRTMVIDISVFPGDQIEPDFPFKQFIEAKSVALPTKWLKNPNDTREQLALYLTWYKNKRFARVMVNRIWRRYVGFGLVEPVDDWQDAKVSHPELLDYLAREFVMSGYDLRYISGLILRSHTYQRKVMKGKSEPLDKHTHLFAGGVRQRMTAEQVVDSLFGIAGKAMKSEPLTMDIDGRRPVSTFLNLGNSPRRAWEFTSLSNERDRPSLAKPRAQMIVDVLKTFGWRETRQNPLTVRDNTPTVQQPAVLSNSVLTKRITGLSDDSYFTKLALEAETPVAWLEGVFLRVLTRKPTGEEKVRYLPIIQQGFDERLVKVDPDQTNNKSLRKAVSWSNHLSVEANKILLEEEKRVRAGDPPTQSLTPNWRERAEDVLWVLVNSPEFIWLP